MQRISLLFISFIFTSGLRCSLDEFPFETFKRPHVSIQIPSILIDRMARNYRNRNIPNMCTIISTDDNHHHEITTVLNVSHLNCEVLRWRTLVVFSLFPQNNRNNIRHFSAEKIISTNWIFLF